MGFSQCKGWHYLGEKMEYMDIDTCEQVAVVAETCRNYFIATSIFSVKQEASLSMQIKKVKEIFRRSGMYEIGTSEWETGCQIMV